MHEQLGRIFYFLRRVFSSKGFPGATVSHQGRQFESRLCDEFFCERNVMHSCSCTARRETTQELDTGYQAGEASPAGFIVDYVDTYRPTPRATTGVLPAWLLHWRQSIEHLSIAGMSYGSDVHFTAGMKSLRESVQARQAYTRRYTEEVLYT